ncbi:hypothetical protein [Pseudomonas syringae]|uniref:hypothetical protein n=1 Tax=Pseudomonas syringae TaxID=317 RepID=UPI000BB66CDA|nr:hypothetical protein [Pseudomonas syringae]MCH5655184.1 hypothetical protein [Pseudomonas syringae]MCK9689805.1 hypothetical protein [Pseudomonas syringae pv. syringae]MDU8417430.1 hypothetical protein [Pseudomonas syringae]MDU8571751.1 hypothetical protein [Pseudomonas syringae]MDU8600398.1 hypothetical protein [Pseudomonas syringae]
MINSDSLKKSSWLAFFTTVFFIAFGPSKLTYFWHVYFLAVTLLFAWTIYLVYLCEKYTTYMTSLINTLIGSFTFLACNVAYISTSSFFGENSSKALITSLTPAIITLLAYLTIASKKPSFHPFEYDGRKIQTRVASTSQPSTSYKTGLIAGATTLAAGIFLQAFGVLTGSVVAALVLTGCCVTILFYMRHVIRGLRTLRAKEHNMPAAYTFMQIDEIREARGRWWLGRLFKWLASLRGSSGA